jgi:hypothetical protein
MSLKCDEYMSIYFDLEFQQLNLIGKCCKLAEAQNGCAVMKTGVYGLIYLDLYLPQ